MYILLVSNLAIVSHTEKSEYHSRSPAAEDRTSKTAEVCTLCTLAGIPPGTPHFQAMDERIERLLCPFCKSNNRIFEK